MVDTAEESSRAAASSEGLSGPLGRWLTGHLPGGDPVEVTGLRRPKGGYSAETWLVDATVGSVPERFVLRRETPDPPIYPTQVPGLDVEVAIQQRVMEALARSGDIPIAPLLGYEGDTSVLGQPFFVMGFVDGQVPGESPPYPAEGFFADAAPAERSAMISNGLRVLAAVHRLDWRGAGLDWLVAPGSRPGVEQQLALWSRYGEAELAGRDHPVLTAAMGWLGAHPPRSGAPVLNWGDSRPGNIIFDGSRCACLTDFEAAAIGPPEMDLGWWLMFDRTVHEGAALDRLPGEPTREEQRAIYEEASGRPAGDVHWFEVFAAARYAMIVVRVMNRAVARGEMPPEQEFWLRNHVVDCLEQLLDEGRGQ